VSVSASFSTKYLDIFASDSYVLPSTEGNITVANQWHNSPLAFWQTQLNFATWCATTGCGVGVHDHLRGHYDFAPDSRNLSQSIFRFHTYYQSRKILHQISAPLPTDEGRNRYNNTYNHTAYQTVCNEFDVDPKSDWRLNRGTKRLARGPGSIFSRFGPELQSYLRQSTTEAENGFLYSTLDQTQGFTHAEIERLNDRIRTYVWVILGSQSEQRTLILGSGAAFTAQKQFLANVEAAIEQAGDTSVVNYQDVLQYARGKLDFVLGEQLCMCPSDMYLVVGHIQGYNNEIQVAATAMLPGTNQSLNTEKLQSIVTHSHGTAMVNDTEDHSIDVTPDQPQTSSSTMVATHEDNKTFLTFAAISAGIVYYLLFR